MKLLQEIIDPNTVNLTVNQQGVLVIIKTSATPEVAYESTNGTEKSVYARNSLRMLGLIKLGINKAVLTQTGEQVLLNYNLSDETGQLTERGKTVITDFNKQNKKDVQPTETSDDNLDQSEPLESSEQQQSLPQS